MAPLYLQGVALHQFLRTLANLGAPSKGDSSSQGHRQRLQRIWRKTPFAAASPFHHSRGKESGYVVAFEVEWASICGLDYSNPLCQDGRLVIEATHIVKREFQKARRCAPAGMHGLWPFACCATPSGVVLVK